MTKEQLNRRYIQYDSDITKEVFKEVWDHLVELGFKSSGGDFDEEWEFFSNTYQVFRLTGDYMETYSTAGNLKKITIAEILGETPHSYANEFFILPQGGLVYIKSINETEKTFSGYSIVENSFENFSSKNYTSLANLRKASNASVKKHFIDYVKKHYKTGAEISDGSILAYTPEEEIVSFQDNIIQVRLYDTSDFDVLVFQGQSWASVAKEGSGDITKKPKPVGIKLRSEEEGRLLKEAWDAAGIPTSYHCNSIGGEGGYHVEDGRGRLKLYNNNFSEIINIFEAARRGIINLPVKDYYIKYLGTKEGSTNKWQVYFGKFGVEVGDVGVITGDPRATYSNSSDDIGATTRGYLRSDDFVVVSKTEYYNNRKCPAPVAAPKQEKIIGISIRSNFEGQLLKDYWKGKGFDNYSLEFDFTRPDVFYYVDTKGHITVASGGDHRANIMTSKLSFPEAIRTGVISIPEERYYIEYLGTKVGDSNWGGYFGKYGVKKGDVGRLKSKTSCSGTLYVEDSIRPSSAGYLQLEDVILISEGEYNSKLRSVNPGVACEPEPEPEFTVAKESLLPNPAKKELEKYPPNTFKKQAPKRKVLRKS